MQQKPKLRRLAKRWHLDEAGLEAGGPTGWLPTLMVSVLALFSPLMAEGEVYLSKAEALTLVLGAETEHVYQPQTVSDAMQQELRSRGLLSEEMKVAHFFRGMKSDRVTGYALIDQEVGKHLPITYIVGVTPEGKVSRVEIMVFREVRGWEVRERRFVQQFEEKGSDDPLVVGAAIRNVTGATLSSRAVAKGVQRALFLWEHFYGKRGGQ